MKRLVPAELARDSHYVPQATLRRWSDDGTHLYAYRILVSSPNVPEWRRRPIRGLAYRRDLYTVFGGGEELDDFERWLSSNYEQPGLEAIDKLVRRARLTPGDWRSMARFVAAQDVRTPLNFIESMRRWNQQIPEILDRTLQESINRFEEASAKGVALHPTSEQSEFSNLLEINIEPPAVPGSDLASVQATVTIGRHFWIASMRHLLTGVAETLCRHRWSVIEPADDQEWPLMDQPVLKLNYYRPGQYDFDGGWGNPGTEIMMPVAPRHLLYVQVGKKIANRFSLALHDTSLVQQLLVKRTHRWVFGRRPLHWVADVRPRTVDRDQLAEEASAWKGWHRDQLQSEIASTRHNRPIETRSTKQRRD